MKRVLSLVLALVMVLGMIPTFAADATGTGAQALYDNGFITGKDGATVEEKLDVNAQLTRAQLAALIAELNAAKEEAAAFEQPADFTDFGAIAGWAKNYISYAAVNGWMTGFPDGTFRANGSVSAAQLAAALMNALGYEVTWNTVLADAAELGIVVEGATLTRGEAFEAMWTTVSTVKMADSDQTLGQFLGKLEAPVPAVLAVTEVKVTSAKSFLVTFNKAVEDTTKAVFTVKKGATPVTVTTTWNEAKTEATVSSAANFAEATYSVNVAYDTKDLGSKDVSFTTQKIAKIEFTSPSMAVQASDATKGFVTFKVFDQYGNDITSTSMANTLNAQVSLAGNPITIRNGLATVTVVAPASLLTYQSLSVSLFDSNSGATATKSFPISTVAGTLTEFTLGSVEGVKLVENDLTSVFYIPYTAKDMAGNETKSFELVSNGIIDADGVPGNGVQLVSSITNVVAEVVNDPTNNKNAVIKVSFQTATSPNWSMDMPLTITAMTYGGKTVSVTTTVAKAKSVDRVVLFAPAEIVAAGETPEIPFEAYDVAGNRITSYMYLKTIVPTGFAVSEKANGEAKFTMTAAAKGTAMLSATTGAGKMSNLLSINVQATAYPASIAFNPAGIIAAMEASDGVVVNATQSIGVGSDSGAGNDLRVYDQYDREMSQGDITSAFAATDSDAGLNLDTAAYYIKATFAAGITVSGGNFDADNDTTVDADKIATGKNFTLTATGTTPGSRTMTFELYKGAALVDSTSAPLTLIAPVDITDFTVAAPTAAIYTVDANGTATDREYEYAYKPTVYGLTSSGTKVALAGTPITNVSLSNDADFFVTDEADLVTGYVSTSSYGPSKIDIVARTLANDKAASSTDVILTVSHLTIVKSLKVALASSATAPVAQEIVLYGANGSGVVSAANSPANNTPTLIQAYDGAGAATASPAYFAIGDSYGTEAMYFKSFKVMKVVRGTTEYAPTDLTVSGVTLTDAGLLTINNASGVNAGDKVFVTAITNNGLTATMVFTAN